MATDSDVAVVKGHDKTRASLKPYLGFKSGTKSQRTPNRPSCRRLSGGSKVGDCSSGERMEGEESSGALLSAKIAADVGW